MSTAIPKDSTVLVTGFNGFIGSHVADQLLQAGYRVRGTTRDASKAKNLMNQWVQKYGKDKIELVIVEDMASKGAFDEAVKGVSGIVHVASVVSFSPDPNEVIPQCLAGVNEILTSAASESTVKRFVFTSSSIACSHPKPNVKFLFDETVWNEEDIKAAHAPPPYEPSRAWPVYGASKTEAEQAVWKFMKEKNPGFITNAVLPDTAFGRIIDSDQPGSSGNMIRALLKGDNSAFLHTPPQYFVDVQDAARLHVSALINLDVKNERIFAFAEPWTSSGILKILRKLRPTANLMDDFQDENIRDESTVANERALDLLKSDFGRSGWTSLEESLANNIEGL